LSRFHAFPQPDPPDQPGGEIKRVLQPLTGTAELAERTTIARQSILARYPPWGAWASAASGANVNRSRRGQAPDGRLARHHRSHRCQAAPLSQARRTCSSADSRSATSPRAGPFRRSVLRSTRRGRQARWLALGLSAPTPQSPPRRDRSPSQRLRHVGEDHADVLPKRGCVDKRPRKHTSGVKIRHEGTEPVLRSMTIACDRPRASCSGCSRDQGNAVHGRRHIAQCVDPASAGAMFGP